jgi:hypothetical protein
VSAVSTTSLHRPAIGTSRPPCLLEAFYECEFWDIVIDTTGGTVERAITRHGER